MYNHDKNSLLTLDRASFRKTTIFQKFVSRYKIFRYGIKAGPGVVIKPSVAFLLTDNSSLNIGTGSIIQDFSFFQLTKPKPSVFIGENVVIGRHNMITAKNSIVIGDYTRIGAFVQILDHGHGISKDSLIADQMAIIGSVSIGRGCWIGAGAKILGHKNLIIGDGAVIGANAVVTKDVPQYAVVGGNPARLLKMRE